MRTVWGDTSGGVPVMGSSCSLPSSASPMMNSPAGIRTSLIPIELLIEMIPTGASARDAAGSTGSAD